ncbi:MAG: hypothetical protein GY813_12695 [Halieaceae bacterium]|nr:hypothetical protein [Halieaceae bacterium]
MAHHCDLILDVTAAANTPGGAASTIHAPQLNDDQMQVDGGASQTVNNRSTRGSTTLFNPLGASTPIAGNGRGQTRDETMTPSGTDPGLRRSKRLRKTAKIKADEEAKMAMDGSAAKKRSKPKRRKKKTRKRTVSSMDESTEDSTPPPPPHFRGNNRNNKNKHTSRVTQPIPNPSHNAQVDLTGDNTPPPPITHALSNNPTDIPFPDIDPPPTDTQPQQTVSAPPPSRQPQQSAPRPDFSNRAPAQDQKGAGDDNNDNGSSPLAWTRTQAPFVEAPALQLQKEVRRAQALCADKSVATMSDAAYDRLQHSLMDKVCVAMGNGRSKSSIGWREANDWTGGVLDIMKRVRERKSQPSQPTNTRSVPHFGHNPNTHSNAANHSNTNNGSQQQWPRASDHGGAPYRDLFGSLNAPPNYSSFPGQDQSMVCLVAIM